MISRFRARLWAQALEDRRTPAVFTVANIQDSGAGSLRQAITDANAATGDDQIVFDSAAFATPQTITLFGALPNISDNLTISGTGAKNLTVTRDASSGEFRIFAVKNPASTLSVTITGMKITNGYCNATSQTDNGGGIYVGGNHSLSLDGVEVIGNTSTAQGGGIAMDQRARLTITNSTVSGNAALGQEFGSPIDNFTGVGGGIYFTFDGSLTLINSTVDNNTATDSGAGVFLYGESQGSALIRNSTISSNTVTNGSSGFIYKSGGAGVAVLTNAFAGGSGTYALTMQNSTVTGNKALGTTQGGGVQLFTSQPNRITLRVESCIIAGNTATTGPDIHGGSPAQKVTVDYSAIGSTSGFTLTNGPGGAASNQTNQSFTLGALAYNGGPTRTHLPPAGSPLIDKGSNPGATSIDQRALTRYYDDPGVSGSLTVDIGAAEAQPPGLPTATASAPAVTAAGSGAQTITVVFADDAGINIGSLGNGDIQVTGPVGYNKTGTFVSSSGSGTSVTATYTVAAPTGGWTGATSGLYTVAMVAGQVNDGTNSVPAGAIGSFQVAVPRSIVVTSAADNVLADSKTTLREAIALANSSYPSNDTITFDPTVFLGGDIITWSLGQMFITDSVTIQGPGPNKLSLDGGSVSRHFNLDGPGTLDVTITGVTLSGGRTSQKLQSERGGSIYDNGENLTLDNVWMLGNAAQQAYGGAIHIQGQGSLTFTNGRLHNNSSPNFAGGAISALDAGHSIAISNSTLIGNVGGYYGGAIFSSGGGSVSIDRSSVKNNSTTLVIPDDQGGTVLTGGGGAVMVANGKIINGAVQEDYPTTSVLAVTDSLFDGNTTAVVGGAVLFNGRTPGSLIRNSTFTNNSTTGNSPGNIGGAVLVGNLVSDPFLIQNSTFAYNKAYSGGGLFIENDNFTSVVADSTIFAQNTSADATQLPPDVDGSLTANYCFFGVVDGAGLGGGSANNQGNGALGSPADPMFDFLQDNGGPTHTLGFLPGSPCLDTGSNVANLSFDQRGAGYARVSKGLPDIGAFELQVASPPTVSSVVFGDGTDQRSIVAQVVVNFSEPVNFTGAVAGAFTLFRSGTGGATGAVGLTANPATGPAGSVTLTFNAGPLVAAGSLIDGFYDLTIDASQVSGLNGLLDGDGNGAGGDSFVVVGDTVNKHFRLFGDVNGDGFTDNVDLIAFRAANGSDTASANWNPAFDSNADGFIDNVDLLAFRQRLGQTP